MGHKLVPMATHAGPMAMMTGGKMEPKPKAKKKAKKKSGKKDYFYGG